MAREALRVLEGDGIASDFLDLRDHPLPLCDAGASYGHPNTALVRHRIEAASGIVVATPIYNYDSNSALKNAVEMTGDAWEDKVVGFLCASGGMGSYMSIMPLANSLMLDFRSVIVPRFAYALGDAFKGATISDSGIAERVAEVARTTARFAGALLPAP
jgi:FMN reductase